MILQIPINPQPQLGGRLTTVGGHARMFPNPKVVAYKKEIALLLGAQYRKLGGKLIPKEVPLFVSYTFARQMPKNWSKKKKAAMKDAPLIVKPDTDNMMKSTKDALTGIIWERDEQIYRESVEKIWSEEPYLRLAILADDRLFDYPLL